MRSASVSQSTQRDPQFLTDYERLLPRIERVREHELVAVDTDIQGAVLLALGAWPEIRTYRAAITAEAPRFDIHRFDDYEAYAHAAGHAHAIYMNVIAPSGNLPLVAEKALLLRNQLVADVNTLASRGLVDGMRLRALRGHRGFRSVAYDLLVLATLVRESWDRIAGKTAIAAEELNSAECMAAQLLNEVDLCKQIPALVDSAARIRQQAYTLFVYGHDQVRRVLSFIRWNHGDADEIAPPLPDRSFRGHREVTRAQARPMASTEYTAKSPEAPIPETTLLSLDVPPEAPGMLATRRHFSMTRV